MPTQAKVDVDSDSLPAGQAARELGISLDTLRRWDRLGKIAVGRDGANRRTVSRAEIARVRGEQPGQLSARNRLSGTVRSVRVEGLLAQVEIEVRAPGTVVAVITADAAHALGLAPGVSATALIKSTSVMVERG